jgi:hypothetical protein
MKKIASTYLHDVETGYARNAQIIALSPSFFDLRWPSSTADAVHAAPVAVTARFGKTPGGYDTYAPPSGGILGGLADHLSMRLVSSTTDRPGLLLVRMSTEDARGAKPLGPTATTDAERQRRSRERKRVGTIRR